jgi:hypothetical protein
MTEGETSETAESDSAPPSEAARFAADDFKLDAIGEAAKLAEMFAHDAVEAAENKNRAALKLRLCMASRALRSALEGFATLEQPP